MKRTKQISMAKEWSRKCSWHLTRSMIQKEREHSPKQAEGEHGHSHEDGGHEHN